jgi:catechol 2,3-dioxygenase-like lactoylglutathione lyase family enzyme
MKAVQFRMARPTNQLEQVARFYSDVLGLEIIGQFKGHEGFDGIMIGLPGKTYHLEFTQHISNMPLPEPTEENLLVFYFDNPEEYTKTNERLQNHGHYPVQPANPYWLNKSETYEDPDKWRIVLFNGVYS